MSKAMSPADTEVYVPEKYEGTLDPNHFCRGWNTKRQKYCRQRAGHNTDHLGVGRCAWHGKGGRMTHGRYSKYVGESLQKHLEDIQAEDGDRTDLTQEVDMFRALTAQFMERYDEMVEALFTWNNREEVDALIDERRSKPQRIPDITVIGKMVQDAAALADKIHAQAHRDSIPKRDFFRLQDAMSDAVAARLRGVSHILGDDQVGDLISGISDDWSEIRL